MNDETPIPTARIRSSWNSEKMLMRGLLTDKKIEQYRAKGYYSSDWRDARRTFWNNRAEKRRQRIGNFEKTPDGRMIYNPT